MLVRRGDSILLCRKNRGTALLILPGGRIEPGETPEDCLARESAEELGTAIEGLAYVGTYEDEAAGEPGKRVRVILYSGALASEPKAAAEIADLVWFGPTSRWDDLAPSLAKKILPDLIARGLLPW